MPPPDIGTRKSGRRGPRKLPRYQTGKRTFAGLALSVRQECSALSSSRLLTRKLDPAAPDNVARVKDSLRFRASQSIRQAGPSAPAREPETIGHSRSSGRFPEPSGIGRSIRHTGEPGIGAVRKSLYAYARSGPVRAAAWIPRAPPR